MSLLQGSLFLYCLHFTEWVLLLFPELTLSEHTLQVDSLAVSLLEVLWKHHYIKKHYSMGITYFPCSTMVSDAACQLLY